jgi:hypothetical protein
MRRATSHVACVRGRGDVSRHAFLLHYHVPVDLMHDTFDVQIDVAAPDDEVAWVAPHPRIALPSRRGVRAGAVR